MGGRRSHQSGPAWSPLSDTHYVDGWNTSEATTKEQDWHLPIANVGRIMKKSLPGSAKISKEAKGIVQECVSEFIGFITSEASDKCRREKRKTINGDDILWAMTTLGFENYAIYLKVFMDKYRESTEGENSMATPGDQPPMEGNSSAVVAEEGDHHQSLVKEMTRKNSPKEGWLLFDGLSSNPASMQLSGVGPECYPVAAPMGQGCVGGGDVGGYVLDYPQLADFTISLGESNMIDADADVVAAALAAQLYHHHHGLAEGF